MHNTNSVAKILDAALTDCFGHHMENTAPPLFPEHDDMIIAERELLDTLTEQQQALYKRLENASASVSIRESDHYYRLGFQDGLTVKVWKEA